MQAAAPAGTEQGCQAATASPAAPRSRPAASVTRTAQDRPSHLHPAAQHAAEAACVCIPAGWQGLGLAAPGSCAAAAPDTGLRPEFAGRHQTACVQGLHEAYISKARPLLEWALGNRSGEAAQTLQVRVAALVVLPAAAACCCRWASPKAHQTPRRNVQALRLLPRAAACRHRAAMLAALGCRLLAVVYRLPTVGWAPPNCRLGTEAATLTGLLQRRR